MSRIRNTVERFILKEPHWFLLVSVQHPIPCSKSHSDVVAGSDQWCDECLGTGYKVELFKVPGRRTSLRMIREERDITAPGYVSQAHSLVYFPEWVRPRDNDILVEVLDWDGMYPRSIFRVYRVMISLPMRQSELSFYECGCNPMDFDAQRLVRAIRGKTISYIKQPRNTS